MAGNSESIDEIIRPVALQQVEDLKKNINELTSIFAEAVKQANALNDATGSSSSISAFKRNAQASNEATKAVVDNAEKARLAEIKLQQAREKAFDDYEKRLQKAQAAADKAQAARDKAAAKEQTNLSKQQADSAKRQAQADKEAANDAKNLLAAQQRVERARRPYIQLQVDLQRLRDEARDLGLLFGENSQQFLEASAKVQELDKRYKSLNATLGDHTPNVGNYANDITKALGGALGFLRTVAYTLPGIGLAGEFNLIGEAISFLVTKATEGKFSLDAFAATATALNKAFENQNFKSAISDVISLREEFKQAGDDVSKQELALDKYNETIGKTVGQTNDLKTAEKLLNDNAKDYIKSMFYKAAAAAALAEGTEDLVKATKSLLTAQANQALTDRDVKQLQNTIATSRNADEVAQARYLLKIGMNAKNADDQALKSAQAYSDKLVNQTTSVYDKLIKLSGKYSEGFNPEDKSAVDTRRANNFVEVNKIMLQTQIDTLNKQAENEQNSYATRRKAFEKSASIQIDLQTQATAQELNSVTLKADEKEVIEKKNSAAIEKIRIDLVEKLRELSNKSIEQDIANYSKDLEARKAAAKKVIDDSEQTYDARKAAIGDYYNSANQLIELREKDALRLAGNNEKSILAAKKDAAKEKLDIDNEANAAERKVDKEANDALKKSLEEGNKIQEELLQKRVIDFKDALDAQLLAIDKSKSDRIKALTDQYTEGKVSASKYNGEVLAIETEASAARIAAQIDAAKQVIFARRTELNFGIGSAKELQKAQDDLTKLQIQSSDLLTKVELDNTKKIEEAKKNLHQIEGQIAQEAVSIIKNVVDSGYQQQINKLKELSDQVDSNASAEKKQVENSLLTTKQKADKEALIDAKAQDQKEQIQQKQLQLQQKQAIFDRATAALNVAVTEGSAIFNLQAKAAEATSTALTLGANPLTAAYAPVAFAAAAAITAEIPALVALGVLQEAAIFATPLPKYRIGTEYAKGGPSIVGDGGAEIVQFPNGKTFLTPDTDTLLNLPTGSKVIPNEKVINMMAAPERFQMIGNQYFDTRELVNEIRTGNIKTVKALTAQKRPVINGWLNEVSQSSAWSNYSRKHFR